MPQTTKVAHRPVKVRDLDIFYRESGPKDALAVLLLYGFPTSSQMFLPARTGELLAQPQDFRGDGKIRNSDGIIGSHRSQKSLVGSYDLPPRQFFSQPLSSVTFLCNGRARS